MKSLNLKLLLTNKIILIPRNFKKIIVLISDINLCFLSILISFYLRIGDWTFFNDLMLIKLITSFVLCISIIIPIFKIYGIYNSILRFSGIFDTKIIIKALLIYGLVYSFLIAGIGFLSVPRTIGIIQPIIVSILIITSRFIANKILTNAPLKVNNKNKKNIFIYGANEKGKFIANMLLSNNQLNVIGYFDDDKQIHGHILDGIKIYDPYNLESIKSSLEINVVIIALENLNNKFHKSFIKKLTSLKINVRTIPSNSEIYKLNIDYTNLKVIDVIDILGREEVIQNLNLIENKLKNKIILVTGAGGSIGSELCKLIIKCKPRILLMIEINEYSLYKINEYLNNYLKINKFYNIEIIPLLASVQDPIRIKNIISTWKPESIFHSAAYKHVSLVEKNPLEAIKNNIFGTLNLVEISVELKIKNFVLISSDKAVRPSNVMGVSKRISEMIVLAFAHQNNTVKNYCIVRFGNVLDSSGSVVPKFREQLERGGPITVSHREVTRYFMTLKEASQLVVHSSILSKGGEIFLLDMGEPVKIYDLALNMIELSGNELKTDNLPDGNIEIVITGLDPGEKIYEELLITNNSEQTCHPRIMKASEDLICYNELMSKIDNLKIETIANNLDNVLIILKNIVNEYSNNTEIQDSVYNKLQIYK